MCLAQNAKLASLMLAKRPANDGIIISGGEAISTLEVIIWYDNCVVKYSSTKFFGDIDNQNKFYMYNAQSVDNPTSFNTKVKALLSSLSGKAYTDIKFYATGELDLGASKKLHGLAQCTRDLSSTDCKKCLDVAVSGLPSCCDGKRGGRVVGGSCNVRLRPNGPLGQWPFV
ncbi:hypothetical protein POTOM_054665 [Populus tomentosa]|uniref:Gnk2-homologous domain-containing protein n=1 Tax=Populus tomentosa TaxID=118781 RepID=A0A8X8C501_POPTO|nr:hypothetical protein POTOM_054665 [Populus tomentosa]